MHIYRGFLSLSFSLFGFLFSPFIHFPSTIFFSFDHFKNFTYLFPFYHQCYLSFINSKAISCYCSNYRFSYIYLFI